MTCVCCSYVESLSEPSPYDTVIQSTATAAVEVVPDLLQFSRPLLDLSIPVITVGHDMRATIAADSAGPAPRPAPAPAPGSGELSREMLRTMTQAMSNLTTSCRTEESRTKIRHSLIDIENGEANK